MRTFQGQTVVIKYGGAAQQEPELKRALRPGHHTAAVPGHPPGGGARRRAPDRQGAGQRWTSPTRFVDGMRVTDQSTMDVVEMVLAGKISKEIVNLINTAWAGAAVG